MKNMKFLAIISALLLICATATAQNNSAWPKANAEDVASVDAIIASLYDVISGPAGEKRDWNRMKSLFIPEGRLVPTFKNQQGQVGIRWWQVDEYIYPDGSGLEKNGFFVGEIYRT